MFENLIKILLITIILKKFLLIYKSCSIHLKFTTILYKNIKNYIKIKFKFIKMFFKKIKLFIEID